MSAPAPEAPKGAIASYATALVSHPKRSLLVAFAVLVALAAIAIPLRGEFSDSFSIPGAESQKAYDLLVERFPQQSGGTATIVYKSTAEGGVANPDTRAAAEALFAEVAALPHVTGIASPYSIPTQVSADGAIAYATVMYDVLPADLGLEEALKLTDMVDATTAPDTTFEVGGEVVSLTEQEFGNKTEIIGLVAALIILLIAFGSVIAAGLPLITAILGLFSGFMLVGIAARFLDIATFTPAFASMIGIGVGIDYALFIVTRYREGLADGLDPKAATIRAIDTAGRAVIFAGGVVIISMLGLGAIGVPFITAIGIATALVVGMAVAVALSFLPALLAIIGYRIDKWSIGRSSGAGTDEQGSPFGLRLSRTIQARPWLYAIAATAILLLLAAPVLDLKLGFPDAGANPTSFHTRRAHDLLLEGFGPGFTSPLLITIEDADGLDQAVLTDLQGAVQGTEGVVYASPPTVNPAGDTAVMTVIPATDANDQATRDLVTTLREDVIPVTLDGTGTQAYIGGQAGGFLDFSARLIERTPWVFAVVIGLSFLLLTVVFRSPVVAAKAALMNVLSIAAAFGVIVGVFQKGWGGSFLGVEEQQPIAVFMPMFLFAILFGLSMDYEVFLLSRIREAWVHGRNTSDAVAEGLTLTARVITAAAAIMIVVFLTFAITDDPIIKQFGIGLATAIFIDATIVRLVLVPSTMELLGDWNWWFPKRLEGFVPYVNIEGTTAPAPEEMASHTAPAD